MSSEPTQKAWHTSAAPGEPDAALRRRLGALCAEGWAIFERFDTEVRDRRFHSFVAAEYELVLDELARHRRPGLRFLEWGSASGVITVMADLLGYEASGIEIDASLVSTARALASRFESGARFVHGSFLPTGYAFNPRELTRWTDGSGAESGYIQLGRALDDFDVVFGYPWGSEEAMMLDLMRSYGQPKALLLLFGVETGVRAYRGGREVPARP